ncbi:MAG: hypothetical protein WAX89_03970 [Alphaproteobacteria bacterium]
MSVSDELLAKRPFPHDAAASYAACQFELQLEMGDAKNANLQNVKLALLQAAQTARYAVLVFVKPPQVVCSLRLFRICKVAAQRGLGLNSIMAFGCGEEQHVRIRLYNYAEIDLEPQQEARAIAFAARYGLNLKPETVVLN